MSLANKISIFRILLVPGIVASLVYYHPSRDGLRYLTLLLFFLGIVSDAVDGYIARSQHQQSQLGAWLDPVADKCLILGTLISLSAIDGLPAEMRIPAWFNLIVISRDALLVAGGIVLLVLGTQGAIRPSRLGKWTTAMQMAVVLVVLLGLPLRGPFLAAATALTVASGIHYLRAGIRVLG